MSSKRYIVLLVNSLSTYLVLMVQRILYKELLTNFLKEPQNLDNLLIPVFIIQVFKSKECWIFSWNHRKVCLLIVSSNIFENITIFFFSPFPDFNDIFRKQEYSWREKLWRLNCLIKKPIDNISKPTRNEAKLFTCCSLLVEIHSLLVTRCKITRY